MKNNLPGMSVLACLILTPARAAAHIGLEYSVAPAGSQYMATFQVGRGCGAAPARQITVTVPAGVQQARPMPKAGWNVQTLRGKRQPDSSSDEVLQVSWTARAAVDMLPTDPYDEFVVSARMPQQAGPI